MRIVIGCDPNAMEAKKKVKSYIEEQGLGTITDFGDEDIIYAHTAVKVAQAVAAGKYDRGILLCGTGIGMCIAANKVKGAYAALAADIYSARRARLSNDANILCLGALTLGDKVMEELVMAFLTSEYEQGGPSQLKIDAYKQYDTER